MHSPSSQSGFSRLWATYIRLPWRLLLIVVYIVLSLPLIIFFRLTAKIVPLAWRLWVGKRWNWVAARYILRVRVRQQGRPCAAPAHIAPNHVSWLDIPVLFSCVPTCFVARDAVRGMPIAGWLAISSGCLFIRRGGGEAAQIAAQMQNRFDAGHNVVAFPEAFAGPGKTVQPFFPRLFAAPITTGVMVQPVAIRYPGDNEGANTDVHCRAPMPMWPSLRSVLVARRTEVYVQFLPPIAAAGMARKMLAAEVHDVINNQVTQWNIEASNINRK